jgi:THO complex subunit 3
LKGHTDSVNQIKFSKTDENILLSCSSDKILKLWDLRVSKNIKSEKTKGGCKNIAWNSDSSMFGFSNKDDELITFYDMNKFAHIKQIEFKNKINEFEFDKINKYLLVTSISGSVQVFDSKILDSIPLLNIEAHFPPVNTINIDKSNLLFATGSADALICIWDMNEMLCRNVIKKGELPIRKIAFSYDSNIIASIYDGPNIDFFNTNTSECIHSIVNETQQFDIAWNPNGYIIAYCGDDKNRNNSDEGNIHLLSIN